MNSSAEDHYERLYYSQDIQKYKHRPNALNLSYVHSYHADRQIEHVYIVYFSHVFVFRLSDLSSIYLHVYVR